MMRIIRVIALFVLFSVLCAYTGEALFLKETDILDTDKDKTDQLEEEKTKLDYEGFAKGEALLTGLSVSAGSAILCSSDGLLIYEKNADVMLPMASITKVMSVLCALETISDLGEIITVSDKAVGIEGSSVYLSRGERVSYEMLIYSAMLESANDAVTALAIAVGGNEEAFVSMMNEKAKELSMDSTNFRNPHGLSENEHFTTARDYAKLMSYALENKVFCKVISTKKAVFEKLDGSMTRVLTNHNRLLNTYSGMLGGKTGFTKSSGRTLVTAARRNETTLICVTLDAPNDWKDHTELFDLGFSCVQTVSITGEELENRVEIAAGESDNVKVRPETAVSVTVSAKEDVSFEAELPHIVFAPVYKGQKLGAIKLYRKGEFFKEIPLLAESDVGIPVKLEEKQSTMERFLDLIRNGRTDKSNE